MEGKELPFSNIFHSFCVIVIIINLHLTQRAIEGHYNTCIYIYTVNKGKGGASGELPSKKSKTQRKRQYRCKIKCKSSGIQMNSDHFAKHNHTKHEGRAYFTEEIEEGKQSN